MSVSGVGQKYGQNNVAIMKRVNSADSAEKTGIVREVSEAEEMESFKKEFYAELEKIPKNGTIVNLAVNISEEAFENMKADPEYRAKILSVLRRDLTSSFAPTKASLLITVGATVQDYRGDSWSDFHDDSEFNMRSQNSFYKKTSEKKDCKGRAGEKQAGKCKGQRKTDGEVIRRLRSQYYDRSCHRR